MKKTFFLFILCMAIQMTFAQKRTLTGTVRDKETKEPIPGVTILEKGTTNGTITDASGAFSISVSPDAVLSATFVGMKSKDIIPGNSRTLSIELEQLVQKIDEVVVVGYGTQKKENLTGAVSTVDIKNSLSGKPINDVGKGLQGVVPGLTITYSNGDIKRSPVISIRGMGSLNASNGGSPLIIVDGIAVTDISLVNPEDIESISVLKDAASTSIYGARAAFGVVLIKTKSGKAGSKFTISYSNNFGWSTPTILPQFPVDQVAEINAMSDAVARSGSSFDMFGMKQDILTAGITNWKQKYANNRKGNQMIKGEDWDIVNGVAYFYRLWDPVKEMYQKWMPEQNHNLQLTGGTEKLNFYLSGAYNYQEGIMKIKPDKLNKYNITLGINAKMNDWLDIDAKIMTRQFDYDYPYGYQDYYYYMWRWGTYFPYGTYTDPNGITANFRNVNGFISAANYCTTRETYTNNNIGANIHLAKTLTLRSEFAYGVTNSANHETGGYISLWDFWAGGLTLNTKLPSAAYDETDFTASKWTQITSNTYLTYEEKFKDHGIKFIGGINMEKGQYFMQFAKRLGLMDVNKGELPLATGTPSVDGNHSDWAVAGYFARLNYNYKGKYLAEANGRYDGSSNFPSNSRWAFFPSFSLGYRISEENWMDVIKPLISDLKIRGSYGSIGNQNVGSDRFVPTMVSGTANWVIGSAKVPYIGSPANVSQSLKWETINTINLGADVRFWKNQAGLSLDLFQRDNENMLAAGATLPATFGSSAAMENAGSLRTSGWEISADVNHSFSNGLNLYASLSVSDYTSKIKKWNSNDAKLLTQNYAGKKIGEIWGFKTDGYFKDANDVSSSPSQVGLQSGNFVYGPGDIKFKNLNGDNVISAGKSTLDDHGDLVVIGNNTPRYQYSLRVGGNWKNFDVDVFFQGVGKRDWWAIGNEAIPYYRGADVMYQHQMDFWTPENPNAKYPRPYPGNGSSAIAGMAFMAGDAPAASGNNFYPQDKYLLNLAYLRLKNLTIGYTIPQLITQKVKIEKVRVYFSGENLFEVQQNKIPIDTEITQGSSTSNFYGRTTPFTRTLSFGVQISL
jgi:TonB-linked SusC/RagA family outer membrane protein